MHTGIQAKAPYVCSFGISAEMFKGAPAEEIAKNDETIVGKTMRPRAEIVYLGSFIIIPVGTSINNLTQSFSV